MWDDYFLHIAKAVASNSKCNSRKLGAVIVRDKFIVSTGYNGPPIGIQHCEKAEVRYGGPPTHDCPRRRLGYGSGEGLWLCPAAHAERNAIDIAARLGHSTDGCTMYCSCPIPCIECAKSIINAGIIEVVVTELVSYETVGWVGQEMLEKAGIKLRVYEE